MRIVFVSDTHSMIPTNDIPDGDVIVCSGDISNRGSEYDVKAFSRWYESLPHAHKIVIAGNHDFSFERTPELAVDWLTKDNDIIYLIDQAIELDGVKFYGSPWQPEFCNWAFNLSRDTGELGEKWAAIPEDTEVLITHGPPAGILDLCDHGEGVGCEELLNEVKHRVKPKIHVFGHIHEAYGTHRTDDTLFINASTCTVRYKPTNPPIVVDLVNGKTTLQRSRR